jgi:hypothetical protein
MSRRQVVGGRGMSPPSAFTPKGYIPHGEEKTTDHDHIAVGDVVVMMSSF